MKHLIERDKGCLQLFAENAGDHKDLAELVSQYETVGGRRRVEQEGSTTEVTNLWQHVEIPLRRKERD